MIDPHTLAYRYDRHRALTAYVAVLFFWGMVLGAIFHVLP